MKNHLSAYPNEIIQVMELFTSFHYELVLVGGWVRDTLLNRQTTDIDMATNASTEEMLKILDGYTTSKIGIKYGTLGVKVNSTWIEITTYRSDHETSDHRHPTSNQFIDSLEEDLKRRDFTINALAMNQAGDLLDYVGGLKDLEDHCIKAIGDPSLRFEEDALRILRAMRFALTLDFEIEAKTQRAMLNQSQLLKHISSERIFEELLKMLGCSHIQNIFKVNQKILLELLPQSHVPSYLDHTDDPVLKLYMLLDSLDQSTLVKILKHYKVSNAITRRLEHLYDYTKIEYELDKVQLKLLMSEVNLEDLKACLLYLKIVHHNAFYDDLNELFESILLSHEPYQLKDLDINGDDLMGIGLSKKQIGETLNQLLEQVIYEPKLNQKNTLLALCQKGLT